MQVKNAKVALSYDIAGSQLLRGEYKYVERTNNGDLIPEGQRLRTLRPSKDSPAKIRLVLSEEFVNHAISPNGLKEGKHSYKIEKLWSKMTPEYRLKYMISKFVDDRGGGKYEYSILSE